MLTIRQPTFNETYNQERFFPHLPMPSEYTEVCQEVDLQKVMDYYAKGFEGSVGRYEYYINPETNKVLFRMFVRAPEVKEKLKGHKTK